MRNAGWLGSVVVPATVVGALAGCGGNSAGSEPPVVADQSRFDRPSESGECVDPAGDIDGPGWLDLVEASIKDDGDTVTVRLRVAEHIPETASGLWSVGVGTSRPGYLAFVDAESRGGDWAYSVELTGGGGRIPVSGQTSGDTVVMQVPKEVMGDPFVSNFQAFAQSPAREITPEFVQDVCPGGEGPAMAAKQ